MVIYVLFEALCIGLLAVFSINPLLQYRPNPKSLTPEQRAMATKVIQGELTEVAVSPTLGWEYIAPNDPTGMRTGYSMAVSAVPGTVRLAAFGDSFTFGSEVSAADSWPTQVHGVSGGRYEVLNYGMGGYGPDQAYLKYRATEDRYGSDIVIIGFMVENIARLVNVFRSYYVRWDRSLAIAKPRFQLVDHELVLFSAPLSSPMDFSSLIDNESETLCRLGQKDYYYQNHYNAGAFDLLPSLRVAKIVNQFVQDRTGDAIWTMAGDYNINSEAYLLLIAIFDRFIDDVLSAGKLPLVLIFPEWDDIQSRSQNKPRRYQALYSALEKKGVPILNLDEPLSDISDEAQKQNIMMPGGHYSPMGNRVVAENLTSYLDSKKFDQKPVLAAAVTRLKKQLKVADHKTAIRIAPNSLNDANCSE